MDGPLATLEALLPEMETVRSVSFDTNIDMYDFLSRAAFAKAFDFAHSTLLQGDESGMSFWVISTMRGIVEDIIVLSAVKNMSRQDREDLLSTWMHVDVLEGTKRQEKFFSTPDRLQSVLTPPATVDDSIASLRSDMRRVWNSYSIDPGHAGRGNIRSLAEAVNLSDMYDYFYEFASRLVHFSPTVLMRSGWGPRDEGGIHAMFRPSNFDAYYQSVARTYSVYLLAEFIDRFGTDLRLPDEFADAAGSIRDELKKVRLPELVTFEEMNLEPPNALLRAIESLVRTGDIPQT